MKSFKLSALVILLLMSANLSSSACPLHSASGDAPAESHEGEKPLNG